MYPHFEESDVAAFRVSRVRHVVALTTLNYSDNLPPMQTSLPGVFAVNSAHIVNGTLNVNETVKLAEDAVRDLLLGNGTDGTDKTNETQAAHVSHKSYASHSSSVAQ